MHLKRFEDATPYEAPNHFDVVGLRLQGFEEGGPTNQWVGLSQFLASQLHEVAPTDPAVYGSAVGVLALAALAAAGLPARRATRIDPVRALRQD